MMSVMLCLQMHGVYKCWGGGGVLMVVFFVERVNSIPYTPSGLSLGHFI